MNNTMLFTEEQRDYLEEVMNIGAGNAATALSQFLQCEVDLDLPKLYVLPLAKVSGIFRDPSEPVLCVKMGVVGEVLGEMFLIVPDDEKKNLIKLARKTLTSLPAKSALVDTSIFEEIGNIMAGVFLTAIHDFSKLNIYHTVPSMAIDMVQSLLDESITRLSRGAQEIIIIENELMVDGGRVRMLLVIVPVLEFIKTLIGSMDEARKM